MNRRPENYMEWELYVSHNVEKLQRYSMAELVALGELLQEIINEYKAPKDAEGLSNESDDL